MEQIGTITVYVYKSENDNEVSTTFTIQADNEDVLPISYVIKDTLKSY